MGKINLKNRHFDNKGDNNIPPKKNTSDLLDAMSHEKSISTINYSKVEPKYSEPVIKKEEEKFNPLSQPQKQNFKKEPIDTRQTVNQIRKSTGLFKEDDASKQSKGVSGRLKVGTSKLKITKKLIKKDESLSAIPNNVLDKFNVNKRMFYIAMGCALLAVVLTWSYIRSATNIFGGTYTVVIAKSYIPEKTIIKYDMLATKDVPSSFLDPNAIIVDKNFSAKDYVGRIAVTDIYKNEQVSSKRIISQSDSIPIIPANTRAFNISSKDTSFIRPKDHVDVLASFPDPFDRNKTINTPVLQNTQVLAVDGKFRLATNEQTQGNVITIAVPNKMVHLFSILQEKATFQVVLKNDEDPTELEAKYSDKQLEKILTGDRNLDEKVIKPVIVITKPVEVKPTIKPTVKPIIEKKRHVIADPDPTPIIKHTKQTKTINHPQTHPSSLPNKTREVKKEIEKETTTLVVINGNDVKQQTVTKNKESENKGDKKAN